MLRALLLFMMTTLVVAACSTNGPSSATQSPTKTADIKRAKLDIAYSAFVDQDVHHVTSKKALQSALDAVRSVVRAAGGKADVATPDFQDVDEPQTADFNKFADTVSQLAASNPNVSASKIADAARTTWRARRSTNRAPSRLAGARR